MNASATTRYVAFLRAINVGGRTVKMDRLRAIFGELGFSDVETFIASGNVIFRTGERDESKLEQQIEAHLQSSLGYPVETFIRSMAELHQIATFEAFPNRADGTTLHIGFLRAPLDAETVARITALETPTDKIGQFGREFYWLVTGRMSDSPITAPMFEKAFGGPAMMTMRNANTVQRIAAKYSID
jgi:uncharacterized protein (DUF1697 family)